jgi:signal transduction histidine kinase
VEVVVRDNGSGISPEHAGRLFEPYFTTKKHGTGLGLFVTRRLVTDHGGAISCESQPGMGATFRVRLPVSAAGESALPVEALAPGSATEEKEVVSW